MPAHLDPSRLVSAETVRRNLSVTPETGITLSDVMKPEYWAHVAARLNRADRIEVVAEDFAWTADLIVADRGRTWAKMLVLRQSAHGEDDLSAGEKRRNTQRENYTVKPAMGGHGYAVWDRSVNAIAAKFPTEDECERWIERKLD